MRVDEQLRTRIERAARKGNAHFELETFLYNLLTMLSQSPWLGHGYGSFEYTFLHDFYAPYFLVVSCFAEYWSFNRYACAHFGSQCR